MNKFELFALQEWLSEYPENKSFNDILDMIYAECEEITPWHVIDSFSPLDIISMITDTKRHAETLFNEVTA